VIIDRLIMKNFKRFRQQEIRFRDGITGILGNNGAGKSTIVEAIFFALYGVQATGILSEYIVSSFASPREKCEVRLDFRVGGDEYTVLRTFRKGKTVQHDATFYRQGKLRATGVSQVETEVRRTLGMGPIDFRNTVYAAQKDLLTLLEHTPGKRKEWFLRALGIDYLKNESDRVLKERIDAKERELQLREGELKGLLDRHDPDTGRNLEVNADECRVALRDLARERDNHVTQREAIVREMQDFSEKKTEHTRLVERQRSLLAEVAGLQQQKDLVNAQVAALAGQEQEYRHLEHELSGFEAKVQRLSELREQRREFDRLLSNRRFAEQECRDIEARIDKERAKRGALDRETDRLSSLRKGIRRHLGIGADVSDQALEEEVASREARIIHAIGNVSARLEHLVNERKAIVSDWNVIESAGPDGVCPLCRQTLGAHFSRIEDEFSSRLEQVEEAALRACGEEDRLNREKDLLIRQRPVLQEIREITERLKSRDSIDADLRELSVVLQEKKASLATINEQIQSMGFDEALHAATEKEVAELERLHRRFVDIGRIIAHADALKNQGIDLELRIGQKKEELTTVRDQIDQTGFNPDEGIRLEEALSAIDSAIRASEAEIARTTERIRYLEELIERHRNEEAAITRLKAQTFALGEETGLLRLTRTVIGEYVLYLMQVVRSRIEAEVSLVLAEITGGRYEQVLLDEDFNLLVRDIDNDYPIERFSGGEQDDIAVALRIALSRYLAGLHQVHESTLLIFDEIFGSQDEERRNNLLTALRTQESRFPQIILISHIPDIQGEFTNTLMVEIGSDLSSRVQEVT